MTDSQITSAVIAAIFMLGANACANLSAVEHKPLSMVLTVIGAAMLAAGYVFLLQVQP